MAARTYVVDLPGGTAQQAVQITAKQTLKQCVISVANAAAGKVELSTISATQIGTSQPTPDVILRISLAASGQSNLVIPINVPVNPFENLYVSQTGAGNLGTVVLS